MADPPNGADAMVPYSTVVLPLLKEIERLKAELARSTDIIANMEEEQRSKRAREELFTNDLLLPTEAVNFILSDGTFGIKNVLMNGPVLDPSSMHSSDPTTLTHEGNNPVGASTSADQWNGNTWKKITLTIPRECLPCHIDDTIRIAGNQSRREGKNPPKMSTTRVLTAYVMDSATNEICKACARKSCKNQTLISLKDEDNAEYDPTNDSHREVQPLVRFNCPLPHQNKEPRTYQMIFRIEDPNDRTFDPVVVGTIEIDSANTRVARGSKKLKTSPFRRPPVALLVCATLKLQVATTSTYHVQLEARAILTW